MKVIKTIAAGEHGSLRFLEEWGDMLFAVRYRDDDVQGVILTTVEIVVDERAKIGKNRNQKGFLEARSRSPVNVRIAYNEHQVKMKAKAAGARWDPSKKFWVMSYKSAVRLGFKGRIVNL